MKPPKIIHINNGECPKCALIFDKYPGFHQGLRDWFKDLQRCVPDAHISCAGRGRAEQEQAFKSGHSNARYGQSAHNFNCAIDLFRLTQQGLSYDVPWFRNTIAPYIYGWNKAMHSFQIEWYGANGAVYYELPHCQVQNWRILKNPPVE